MKEARLRAALLRKETVSQARMADLVSKELGRSIQQTQWGRYESEENEPPLDVIRAAAKVSELAPEYIAFGVVADDLSPDPDRDHLLTEEELDAAQAEAEAIQRERDRKSGGAGKRRKRPA